MEKLLYSLTVSIMAGVLSHYILKWLDENENKDINQPKKRLERLLQSFCVSNMSNFTLLVTTIIHLSIVFYNFYLFFTNFICFLLFKKR